MIIIEKSSHPSNQTKEMVNKIKIVSKFEIMQLLDVLERNIGIKFNRELDRMRERLTKLEDRAYFVQGG